MRLRHAVFALRRASDLRSRDVSRARWMQAERAAAGSLTA
jgi:hypothetical protein